MTTLSNLAEIFIQDFGEAIHESSHEMKFLCPECKHKGLYGNKATGVFHCFHCGFKGKKEGKAEIIPQKVVNSALQLKMLHTIVDESTLNKGHQTYLAGRGIYHPERWGLVTIPARVHSLLLSHYTADQLEDAGLVFQTSRGSLLCKFLEPRRILIPFWSGDHFIGAKTRANPYDPDANPAYKYLAAPGTKIGASIFYRGEIKGDFILTEGELKAIVGNEEGFTVGATSGMTPSTSSLAQISRIVNSSAVKRFFIAYDSSPGVWSDPGMVKTLYKLVTLCPKKACIVMLPLASGQMKEDLDSFIVKKGPEELDNLLEVSWLNRHHAVDKLRYSINSIGLTLHGYNQVRTKRT